MKPRKKTSFVIMPFSSTATCSALEWTNIFESLFKPALELHGYRCERYQPSTGNIIEGILQQLYESDLVVADLTDGNTNVFYELGIRHALRNCSLMLAQKTSDVPSDLRSYAFHQYRWVPPTRRRGHQKCFEVGG